MIKQLLLISFILLSSNVFGQQKQEKTRLGEFLDQETSHPNDYRGLEIGFNVTTVLSRFVGNGPGIDAQDFPFLLRFHRDRFAFRVGLGANFKSDSFFDATTFTNRNTEEKVGVLKVGLERKVDLRYKLSFYYGLDVFGGLIQESVSTSNFSSSDLTKDITRFGGGPFMGISYSINDRVRLHTETNITGFFETATTSEINGGVTISSVTTDSVRAELETPISLYINLKF